MRTQNRECCDADTTLQCLAFFIWASLSIARLSRALKGKNASVTLCNSAVVAVKVITLNSSCNDLYEGKRTCLKMIKEQPYTQASVTQ